jgi:hypothetical protein
VGTALLGIVLFPVAHNISAGMNKNFGWAGISVQKSITRFNQWWGGNGAKERAARAEQAKQGLWWAMGQMREIDHKYQIGSLPEAEAVTLWNQVEEVALLYGNEWNAVLPENVKAGRSYYQNANIHLPIFFATAAASITAEKLGWTGQIRWLDERTAGRTLTAAEQEQRREAQAAIEDCDARLATVCAMERVNDIFYPEYSRARFMREHPEAASLLETHATVRRGMRMGNYAKTVLKEFDKRLEELNIPAGARKF